MHVILFLLSHAHVPALAARRCVNGEVLRLPSVPKSRYVDSLNGSCSLKQLDLRTGLNCERSDERMFPNDFSHRKFHFLVDRKEQKNIISTYSVVVNLPVRIGGKILFCSLLPTQQSPGIPGA